MSAAREGEPTLHRVHAVGSRRTVVLCMFSSLSLVSLVIDVFFLMLMLFGCVYRLGPAVLTTWTTSVEAALKFSQPPEGPLDTIHQALNLLADIMLQELSPVTCRKCEHLIMELIQQHDVTRSLIHQRVLNTKGFTWLYGYQMRFYLDRAVENPLERLLIKNADASSPYGWEYLGPMGGQKSFQLFTNLLTSPPEPRELH